MRVTVTIEMNVCGFPSLAQEGGGGVGVGALEAKATHGAEEDAKPISNRWGRAQGWGHCKGDA